MLNPGGYHGWYGFLPPEEVAEMLVVRLDYKMSPQKILTEFVTPKTISNALRSNWVLGLPCPNS